ncbi:MAG: aldehyde dehydrogenase family protein [Mycoplasmoidaceae bacterium]
MKNYQILLNGKMTSRKETIEIISPETQKPVGTVPRISSDEIEKIFLDAKAAFQTWKNSDHKIRINHIKKLKKLFLENKETIAHVMVQEIAKGFNDAVKEVERTCEYIDLTILEYTKYYLIPKKIHEDKPNGKIGFIKREPVGVVVCISPFNYPINLAISKIIPALILGNTVVFKPATNGSLTGALISKYFHEAKFPKNVFNIITGKGSEIGDLIITNKNANMISFTGGVVVGKKILFENQGLPIVLELGGKDPAIVFEDAILIKSAKEIVKGALNFAGQRCTAIKIVYAHKDIIKKLTSLIVQEVKQLSVGKAINNSDITALVNQTSLKWAKGLIEDAKNKGAVICCGEKNEANLLYPTVLTNVTQEMLIFDEEQFAPIIPIVEFNNIEEVIAATNASKYGLQASIFTKSQRKFNQLANELDYSTINFNLAPTRGPDVFPFTGNKDSGFGVQGIYWALESMSKIKLFK